LNSQGSGFATILSGLGLPKGSLALSLVHELQLRVELGQLAIVAAFLLLAYSDPPLLVIPKVGSYRRIAGGDRHLPRVVHRTGLRSPAASGLAGCPFEHGRSCEYAIRPTGFITTELL